MLHKRVYYFECSTKLTADQYLRLQHGHLRYRDRLKLGGRVPPARSIKRPRRKHIPGTSQESMTVCSTPTRRLGAVNTSGIDEELMLSETK